MRSVQTEEDGTSSRKYFFDHIFLYRSPQSLPHEFSDAQISQHCDKRKLAESMRPEWEIRSYLFASILRYYRNLRRTRGGRTSSASCSRS